MNILIGTFLFGAGLVLGLLIMWLVSQTRHSHLQSSIATASAELVGKNQRVESLTLDLQRALETKARAEQEAQRVPQLEGELVQARGANNELQIQLAEVRKDREADQEKIRWADSAQQTLREAFKALAAEALQTNAADLLNRARDQLEGVLSEVRGDWSTHKEQLDKLVEPLGTALKELDEQVHELEQKREGAYQGLQEQLCQLKDAHGQLQISTVSLVQALKSPVVRARWGEVQLRRVVEMAGLVEHVDFSEQAGTETGRPDMTVLLPNRGVLVVDAKAPMKAYLEAMEAAEDSTRDAKLDLHVRTVRQHIQQLGSRRYWQQFERTPELVVMFVPSEASLGAAFERDPDLLDFAIQQRVLLTTPITLLALLKAVAYGWQQYKVAEHARQIAEHGRQLHKRLRVFLAHLVELGRRLDRTVGSYNEAVGSLEIRVLPVARRIGGMGVGSEELPTPAPVERSPRLPTSSEEAVNMEDSVTLAPGASPHGAAEPEAET